MKTGVVKAFNMNTGRGIVVVDETGQEILLFQAYFKDLDIRENDQVAFEISNTKKGLCAINVMRT